MTAVQVLPDELVNQIAAGEVVERPASVVKELVENALDAGATRIDVAIAGGGSRWIAVSDDGCGMSREDAELAFQRHATSKIRTASDLASVATLGFRGEALPSIASVAAVRVRTRPEGAELGVELAGQGGGIDVVREVACPAGTRVEVADLFAQIPARLKFLKTEVTEAGQILRWLERIALARPDVRFSLERDGRAAVLFPPTGDARERAVAVLPPSVGERLLPVSGRIETADLQGFATPTDVQRGSTGDIHLLVNARPVRDRLLLHAVRHAYRDALPSGRHPAAVLYLRVDPGELDVNVHPAKAEVRFRDPGAIRGLVTGSLVRALGLGSRAGTPVPVSYAAAPTGFTRVSERGPPADLPLQPPRAAAPGAGPGAAPLVGPADAPASVPLARHRYLGQAFGTYLILEGPEALLVLDQHAAHERVLFERLRQSLIDEKPQRQALLVPVRCELPRASVDVLAEHAELLERAGFELETAESGVRGGLALTIRAVPAALSMRAEPDWAELLEETATALGDAEAAGLRSGLEAALHGVLATAACHAAIRKGDRLDPREVQGLLEALDDTVWFPNCPHGRPILMSWPEIELERRFGRR